ncbi:MAG: DUF1992 domain-containing protein [Zoogloeaceae bacterium]|jgi:hypothetical protein|nr:DUF1992 domain-containing protein [Zoogloeaceae bacterium]
MHLLNILAEQKIRAAEADGLFDALPGAGHALDFGDELLVPDEVRAAYRVLKNSGFLPPEIERMREAEHLHRRLAELPLEEGERKKLRARLLAIESTLAAGRGNGLNIPPAYRGKILVKFSAPNPESDKE